MSLAKLFNFRPKEYAASSHNVRSKKIIRTWANRLKRVKQAKQVKGAAQQQQQQAAKAPEATQA
jgi:Holliday junction resolvasome RuvABC ATP-dependent DNA helicase subunit